MMEHMVASLLEKILAQTGLIGLGMAVAGVVVWKLHEMRTVELKASIEEHRTDKADYRQVITGNTEVIGKMAGAIETNTQTIRDLRSYMERRP